MGQLQSGTNIDTRGLHLFYTPLGGSNSDRIGSNCGLITLGHMENGQIIGESILIDAGAHPAHWTPDGWQQKLPDLRQVLSPDWPAPVRAIFLTHAHQDHHAAVVHYAAIGLSLPPIFCSPLTRHLLVQDLRDAKISAILQPELRTLEPCESAHISGMTIEAVTMGHSLTGYGYKISGGGVSAFFTSDFKMDQTTLTPATDLARLTRMGIEGEIDYLMVDSTRAQQEGTTVPEAEIRQRILDITNQHPYERINMVIMGSSAEGLARGAWVASKTHRVAVHHGCSIERTLRAMNATGLSLPNLIEPTLQENESLQLTSGSSKFANRMSPSFIFNIMSGAQGEKTSTLARKTFTSRDVIIISASTLPWNKRKIERLVQSWRTMGVEHIYTEHASGHEQGGGLLQLNELVRSKAGILPTHGSLAQRQACCDRFNARSTGAPAFRIDNGLTLQLTPHGPREVDLHNPPARDFLTVPAQPDFRKYLQLKAA